MTVTTEETVVVDGTTLNTLAYNIASLDGRVGTAATRGSNKKMPFRPGRLWKAKSWDAKTELWGMWVRGADVNGVNRSRTTFNDNVETLMALFGVNHRTLSVTRTKRLTAGLITRTADCEVTRPITARAHGPNMMSLVVELGFPYPFWEGAQQIDILTAAGSIANSGQVELEKMVVRLEAVIGSQANVGITNTAYTTNLVLAYPPLLLLGEYVDVDVLAGTAIHSVSGDVSGAVTHSGAQQMFKLLPGANSVTIQGGANSKVTVTTNPAYHV